MTGEQVARRLLELVAERLQAGAFDGAVDLAVNAWHGQPGEDESAAYCLWLAGGLQDVGRVSPSSALEVALVVAQKVGALRALGRALSGLGAGIRRELEGQGADVDEATMSVLTPMVSKTQ